MSNKNLILQPNYSSLVGDISKLLETARKESARTVNALLTATYWMIGYRIVEFEYKDKERVQHYGDNLLNKLSKDLVVKYGRGFSRPNLTNMKQFYKIYTNKKIRQTLSDKSFTDENFHSISDYFAIPQTLSAESLLLEIANNFQLPWSAYVRLLSVKDNDAREFYEAEILRIGWSVRQLDRQISSQFYERTLLSKNKSKC